MDWQPQLWAGSTRGTNLCVWPRHWFLASPVWAYRSCFFLEICLDLVKAALLDSRLETGAARVQASVAHQTWKGLTSRLALWQSPGKGLTGSVFLRLYLKTTGLGGLGFPLKVWLFHIVKIPVAVSGCRAWKFTARLSWARWQQGLCCGVALALGCLREGRSW